MEAFECPHKSMTLRHNVTHDFLLHNSASFRCTVNEPNKLVCLQGNHRTRKAPELGKPYNYEKGDGIVRDGEKY